MKIDLSLVPRDELLLELESRYETCFFTGHNDRSVEVGEFFFRSKGSVIPLKGLCYLSDLRIGHMLGTMLMDIIRRQEEKEDS